MHRMCWKYFALHWPFMPTLIDFSLIRDVNIDFLNISIKCTLKGQCDIELKSQTKNN